MYVRIYLHVHTNRYLCAHTRYVCNTCTVQCIHTHTHTHLYDKSLSMDDTPLTAEGRVLLSKKRKESAFVLSCHRLTVETTAPTSEVVNRLALVLLEGGCKALLRDLTATKKLAGARVYTIDPLPPLQIMM